MNHTSDQHPWFIVLHLYKRLLKLRIQSPALHSGDLALHANTSPGTLAYTRSDGTSAWTVHPNFSDTLHCPAGSGTRIELSTDDRNHIHRDTLYLQPHSAVIAET